MAGRKKLEIKKRYMQIGMPEDLETILLKFCRDESMAKKEHVAKSDVILAALVYYLSEVKKCDMTIMDKEEDGEKSGGQEGFKKSLEPI